MSLANKSSGWSFKVSTPKIHELRSPLHRSALSATAYQIEFPLPLCHNRDSLLLQTDNVVYHVLGEGIQTIDILTPKVFNACFN